MGYFITMRSASLGLLIFAVSCLAGVFAVHGLSTPGVLQRDAKAADAGLVVGISAELALWTSALFFAIRSKEFFAASHHKFITRIVVSRDVDLTLSEHEIRDLVVTGACETLRLEMLLWVDVMHVAAIHQQVEDCDVAEDGGRKSVHWC